MGRILEIFVALFISMSNAFAQDTLRVFDKTTPGIVNIEGDVDPRMVATVYDAFKDHVGKDITMVINSDGGRIDSYFKIREIMKSSKKNITCFAITAKSSAFMIFQDCNIRLMAETSDIMAHEISGMVEIGGGSEISMRTRTEHQFKYFDIFHAIVARRLNMSLDAYRELIRNELWMYGREAVERGFADELVYVKF